MTVTDTDDARTYLSAIGHDPGGTFDLLEAALALGILGRPGVRLDWYRDHVSRLIGMVSERIDAADGPVSPERAGEILSEVIAGHNGYAGDTLGYEDIQNANLLRVIDRRKGLPVTLGILYLCVARAQGWQAVGLNFPAHFLIRIELSGERLIIDPFNNGAACHAADLRTLLKGSIGANAELDPSFYEPVDDRQTLLRLQNNIKLRRLRSGNIDEALETLRTMQLIAPDEPILWREAGILNAQCGRVEPAIEALEHFLEIENEENPRHQAAMLLQQLRNRSN